jgi:hypothetical protein
LAIDNGDKGGRTVSPYFRRSRLVLRHGFPRHSLDGVLLRMVDEYSVNRLDEERPKLVRVVHRKTREENWIPLFDLNGAPLYPALMAELDAL